MWPKVLIGVTTYNKKDYIAKKFFENLRKIDYPREQYDVLVVDNTNDGGRYFRKLKRTYRQAWVEKVSRGANSREALTNSQNLIRKRLLEGDYEYLLMLESDLLPAPNQLKRLVNTGKEVVGSTYIIGTGNVQIPCIFLSDFRMGGMAGTRPLGMIRDPETGKNSAVDYNEVNEFLARGGIQRCHGVGFGCTLLHRKIVEKYPFWCDERFNNKHSDVYFYLDLERGNVPVFVDTDVIVPHHPIPWESVADR